MVFQFLSQNVSSIFSKGHRLLGQLKILLAQNTKKASLSIFPKLHSSDIAIFFNLVYPGIDYGLGPKAKGKYHTLSLNHAGVPRFCRGNSSYRTLQEIRFCCWESYRIALEKGTTAMWRGRQGHPKPRNLPNSPQIHFPFYHTQ